jgi:glycosyltransferase involved in cell wall biosynthesis
MSNEPQPLVSVVTPFYNTELFLAECIESVLAQTYQNWEYVLVNNCSTDRSAEIAARYAAVDPRIRLLHNATFLSQVENYNHALRQISPSSRYCKMVQADDWIYPDCIKEMVAAAERSRDIVLVGAFSLCETELVYGGLPYASKVLPGKDAMRKYLVDELALFGSPTCVMYRSGEVRAKHAFFDPESPVDDMQACFDLLLHGDLGFVHQVLTFTRRQGDSIWSGIAAHSPTHLHRMFLTYRYAPLVIEDGWREAVRRRETRYYAFLGSKVFSRRPSGFWTYHKEGLEKAGAKMQWTRVAASAARELLDMLGNPKASLERMFGKR